MIRGKLVLMKVVVMTTALPIDEVAAFYEKTVPRAEFAFGVRDLQADLEEGIRSGDINADPERVREAAGEKGRSARWTREAERLSIAIEDHLIDPRDGRIVRRPSFWSPPSETDGWTSIFPAATPAYLRLALLWGLLLVASSPAGAPSSSGSSAPTDGSTSASARRSASR